MTTPENAPGFTFPGMFDITAIGAADAGLDVVLQQQIEARGVAVLAGSLRTRPSSGGHYLSVTLSFLCPDRATHEAIYEAARSHPAVKWTL